MAVPAAEEIAIASPPNIGGEAGAAAPGGIGAGGTGDMRGTLLADQHAARSAAVARPVIRTNSAAEDLALQSEASLNEGQRFRAETQRMNIEQGRTAYLAENTGVAESTLDDMVEEMPDYGIGDSYDPVQRLRQQVRSQALQMQNQAVDELEKSGAMSVASDGITATIQSAGFTSFTFMDMFTGMLIGFPGTVIQMLVTWGIVRKPEDPKGKLLHSALDYHLESAKGWGKMVSGVVILLYAGVIITVLCALLLLILSPMIALLGDDETPAAQVQQQQQAAQNAQ